MALDMAKYRRLFLEEATEHLREMSQGLLELEKDGSAAGSIDLIFRMAHSIKSMAASLGYDSISEVAHILEDRMQEVRSAGCVASSSELGVLFKGLEGLESMVEHVRNHGEAPAADEALLASLSQPSEAAPEAAPASEPGLVAPDAAPKKKVLS